MSLIEYHFSCPCCFSQISMLLDLSISNQLYIEDCEVCCRPIEVNFEVHGGEVSFFTANPVES